MFFEEQIAAMLLSVFGSPLLLGFFFIFLLFVIAVAFGIPPQPLFVILIIGYLGLGTYMIPEIRSIAVLILGWFIGVYLIYKWLAR
jgi:hypothetical protein